VGQAALTSGTATCRNSGCGRDDLREELSLTPRKYREREKRLQQDKVDAIEREFKDKHRKIALSRQNQIRTGIDDEFPYDPDTREISMSSQEADAYNRASAEQFLRDNPTYFPTQRNLELIRSYLKRHGVDALVSARQLQLVYERLDAYSLLDRRPEPIVIQPEPTPYVNLCERAPEPPKRREPEEGWDLRTGERRMYTPYEIDRLSGDDYRRIFRLYGDRKPTFPTHAAF
jgi:hypothetical protein